jgi:hypothetical protein
VGLAIALIVGIVVVLVGAIGGTYLWTQTQYFVGRSGERVAIFRGVNASVGPVKLYSVDAYYRMVSFDALLPAFRTQVASGIRADSEADAKRIIDDLLKNSRPCPVELPTPPPSTPPPSPSTSASAGSTTPPPRRTTSTPTRPPTRSASQQQPRAVAGVGSRTPAVVGASSGSPCGEGP